MEPAPLARRERRALELLSHGLTVPMVADVMGEGPATVAGYLAAARLKLRAKNETHTVANAIRWGMIR